MKVGQGRGRAVEELRGQREQDAQRQRMGRGEEGRRFAELLERKSSEVEEQMGSLGDEEVVGDEEGRRLEAGEVQWEEREEELQLLDRTGRGADVEERLEHFERAMGGEVEGRSVLSELKGDEEVRGEVWRESDVDAEVIELLGQGERQEDVGLRGAEQVVGSASSGEAVSKVMAAQVEGGEGSLDAMARQIVNAVQVGEDGQSRRVIFLDITVPGHGDVRVRLRRDGAGMEVRMRADNDGFARTLRQYSERLRGDASEQGVQLTSIQVVR